MSDASKAKSEEEWRAILSPEQVRPVIASHGPITVFTQSTRVVQGAPDEGHRASWDGRVRG